MTSPWRQDRPVTAEMPWPCAHRVRLCLRSLGDDGLWDLGMMGCGDLWDDSGILWDIDGIYRYTLCGEDR